MIVRRQHNVAYLEACGFGRSVGFHVGDQYSPTAFESESRSQCRRDGLRSCFDLGAVYMPVPAQAFVYEAHDASGNREAKTLAAAAARQNEGIDTHHVSVHIDERPPAVSRIDRGIGLDVDHSLVRIGLPRHRTDHAHGYGVLQAFRATHREPQLALSNPAIRFQRQSRQFLRADLEQCKVALLMYAHQLGLKDAALAFWLERSAFHDGHRKDDANSARAFHHVRVGHHVAARVHYHTRPDGPLPRDQCGFLVPAFFDGTVTSYQDLHHALRTLISEPLQGRVQLDEAIGCARRACLDLLAAFFLSRRWTISRNHLSILPALGPARCK